MHTSRTSKQSARLARAPTPNRLGQGVPVSPVDLQPQDKILITGARGLVGSALAAVLTSAGYTNLLLVGSNDVDLRDEHRTNLLFQSEHPDVVFHLAARVYGLMGNLANKSNVFIDNVRINTNVIESCRRSNVRKVIAMGSAAIYGDSVPLPMRESDVWTGPPHASERPYAHAKRTMLAQLETYREHDGLSFAYCISTNLYGPNDKFDEHWGHVIPSLISKFHSANASGKPVSVWGTGAPTRDLLYSYDVAIALRLIAERGQGVINLATGESHTIRQIVELIADVSDYTGSIAWDGSKPDGQQQRSYDVTILNALGFTPRWSLKEGLRETYRWYEANAATARR